MQELRSLLDLPLDTLAVLAGGYMSYRLAYTGKDATHGAVDVLFLTLVFALIARMAIAKSAAMGCPEIIGIFAGMAAALVASAVWRRWGERAVFRLLRSGGVSASDRQQSVWRSMLARPPAMGPTRLFVRLGDGTRLMCERLADFNAAPLGPCLLGDDGSVALYVTHRKAPGSSEWEDDQDMHKIAADWGPEMTFLAANQIAEVRINFPTGPSASVAPA